MAKWYRIIIWAWIGEALKFQQFNGFVILFVILVIYEMRICQKHFSFPLCVTNKVKSAKNSKIWPAYAYFYSSASSLPSAELVFKPTTAFVYSHYHCVTEISNLQSVYYAWRCFVETLADIGCIGWLVRWMLVLTIQYTSIIWMRRSKKMVCFLLFLLHCMHCNICLFILLLFRFCLALMYATVNSSQYLGQICKTS